MKNVLKAIEYYLNVIDLLVDSDENYKLLFLSHYYLGNLYSEQELFEDELLMHKKAYYYFTGRQYEYCICLTGDRYYLFRN